MSTKIRKRPVSPRQKMINLMYVLLMAMLALNVSNEVLKGFSLMEKSLHRTTLNTDKENQNILQDLSLQLKSNPEKVQPWYNKAIKIKEYSDHLFNLAQQLRLAIAEEADGANANPEHLKNEDDLEAAATVMLSPIKGKGKLLYEEINQYRDEILKYVSDPKQRAIISSDLSTQVPKNDNSLLGKNWQEYMFEDMPATAAITMLSKLQSDVRKTENQVLHIIKANIDIKDIRVNELNAYVLPESTTLFPGEVFNSKIFMAAVDTTQKPKIFINGREISQNGTYNFTVGNPGEYSFSGYMLISNRSGQIIRRNFSQKYKVLPSPTGATVAADMMNVLYAGFNNPVSVSASGIPMNKVQLSAQGGALSAKGNGHYIVRPEAIGKNVIFTVNGEINGKMQIMGHYVFKVRKLPDPTAYLAIGNNRFKGGKLSKGSILSTHNVQAAIDDGLLDIKFSVKSFEMVFFDQMGNARPEISNSSNITENQRDLIRSLRRGQRFYISHIIATGPDGLQRALSQALEVIVN